MYTILYHIKMLTPDGGRIIMDFNGIIEHILNTVRIHEPTVYFSGQTGLNTTTSGDFG